MRFPRYRIVVLASMLLALAAACAGANGDPAPAAVEAGTPDPSLINCVDAGATE